MQLQVLTGHYLEDLGVIWRELLCHLGGAIWHEEAAQMVTQHDNVWGDANDIADVPTVLVERLTHYFGTYKMIPGKEVDIKVDFVYGREEALKVIAASQKDYENHFGHLLRKEQD